MGPFVVAVTVVMVVVPQGIKPPPSRAANWLLRTEGGVVTWTHVLRSELLAGAQSQ